MKKVLKTIYEFLRMVFRPFGVIKYHRMSFFLWMMFTLIGGLIGVLVSVAKYTLFDNQISLSQAIYIESINGSFYTYSIAIVAAVLSSIFCLFSEKKELAFRRYQIPLVTFSIFVLLFGGVFYALSKNSVFNVNDIPNPDAIVVEWKQFVIFFLSVLFSVYSFCVCRLDEHYKDFDDISDDRLINSQPKDEEHDADQTKN